MTKKPRKKKSSWTKLPQIESHALHFGCLNCSSACLKAPLDMDISVGFGYSCVTKDGDFILDGENDKSPVTVNRAERMAAKDPDHDWRIVRHGPLHGETFQRHGKDEWICIESNQGFA